MRSSTPAKPKRRRRPTSIAALIALCALAAGVQTLVPASAGAMTDQTTCLNMAIPGVGLVPGMGVAKDSEGNLYVCKLDSAGDVYGGTDRKKDSTRNQPICTGRSCVPHQIGGGAGSGEVAGPRAGGGRPPATKPVGAPPKEKASLEDCLKFGFDAMIGDERVRIAHKAELRKKIKGLQFRRGETWNEAVQQTRPKLRKGLEDASRKLGEEIDKAPGSDPRDR